MRKPIRMKLVSMRVELVNEDGTLADCEFSVPPSRRRPGVIVRNRRDLFIEGVITELTGQQKRAISKKVRAARRVVESQ
jgi:hypothetical protein